MDDTYLEVVLGLGFVGLLVFVLPVIITAFGLLRTIPKKTDSPLFTSMWLQLMALFVILFVRSLTGPSFHVLHPSLVMFMLLCIGVAALPRLRYERQSVHETGKKVPVAENVRRRTRGVTPSS